MMAKLLSQAGFKMSIHRVNNPCYFDQAANELPANGLHQMVSSVINIPYLSKYEGSQEELRRSFKYQGKIIGANKRMFFSIPTARIHSQEYYYVNYLSDTGLSVTTLSHETLCCLYGKNVDSDDVSFPVSLTVLIGGYQATIDLSRPNPKLKRPIHNYPNINLLGMDFLCKFKEFSLKFDSSRKTVFLDLI